MYKSLGSVTLVGYHMVSSIVGHQCYPSLCQEGHWVYSVRSTYSPLLCVVGTTTPSYGGHICAVRTGGGAGISV